MTESKKNIGRLEKEKKFYTACFSVLAAGLILALCLSAGSYINIKNKITGAAVVDEQLIQEKFIDYESVSNQNIDQETALKAIMQAEADMKEMQRNGFGVQWINDTLAEARRYFKGEDYLALAESMNLTEDNEAMQLLAKAQKEVGVETDYALVLEKAKSINDRKRKAYEITDSFIISELMISEAEQETQADFSSAYSLLDSAKAEFDDERYEEALAKLDEAEQDVSRIQAENTYVLTLYRAGKQNTVAFVKDHYISIIAIVIILAVLFLLSYNRITVRLLKKKIKYMKLERETLLELMKKAQMDYFSKKTLPKSTYDLRMKKYKEDIAKIKRELPVVQQRLSKLYKMKRII